jgi:succinate dehydrogenase/fumarate reductase-like Fe-S protein
VGWIQPGRGLRWTWQGVLTASLMGEARRVEVALGPAMAALRWLHRMCEVKKTCAWRRRCREGHCNGGVYAEEGPPGTAGSG